MDSTTSQIPMTTKGSSGRLVLCTLFLAMVSGCATPYPVEAPICLPSRYVLEDISVSEQFEIREKISEDLLRRIGTNDTTLKSQIRLLEGLIQAHDQPLGDC